MLALLVLAGAAAAFWWNRPLPLPHGISAGEYETAASQFEDRYGKQPDRLDVLSFAAELAVVDGRREDALACFAEIPSDHPRYGLSARLQAGQLLLELNRVREAEASLREFLLLAARTQAVPPLHIIEARKKLAFLLSVQLRIEERQSLLRSAHDSGLVDVFDSKQFFFPHLLIWNSTTGRERLAEFLKLDPDNRHLRIAEARYLTFQGSLQEAQTRLENLLAEQPDDLVAAAALLECHFEADDQDRFARVLQSVPEYRVAEPWLLTRMRGHDAVEHEDWERAVTRFQQVLASDRTNPWAQSGLARAYGKLNQTAPAQAASARSATIARIRTDLARDDRGEVLDELAEDCGKIGLPDAAAVFRHHAQTFRRSRGR